MVNGNCEIIQHSFMIFQKGAVVTVSGHTYIVHFL